MDFSGVTEMPACGRCGAQIPQQDIQGKKYAMMGGKMICAGCRAELTAAKAGQGAKPAAPTPAAGAKPAGKAAAAASPAARAKAPVAGPVGRRSPRMGTSRLKKDRQAEADASAGEGEEGAEEEVPRKKKSKLPLIMGICGGVAVVAIIAVLLILRSKNEAPSDFDSQAAYTRVKVFRDKNPGKYAALIAEIDKEMPAIKGSKNEQEVSKWRKNAEEYVKSKGDAAANEAKLQAFFAEAEKPDVDPDDIAKRAQEFLRDDPYADSDVKSKLNNIVADMGTRRVQKAFDAAKLWIEQNPDKFEEGIEKYNEILKTFKDMKDEKSVAVLKEVKSAVDALKEKDATSRAEKPGEEAILFDTKDKERRDISKWLIRGEGAKAEVVEVDGETVIRFTNTSTKTSGKQSEVNAQMLYGSYGWTDVELKFEFKVVKGTMKPAVRATSAWNWGGRTPMRAKGKVEGEASFSDNYYERKIIAEGSQTILRVGDGEPEEDDTNIPKSGKVGFVLEGEGEVLIRFVSVTLR
jgi:hypothetical protein